MPIKTARTLASVRAELTTVAMTIRFNRHNDEYRVNFKNGLEVDAYYTNDLADALSTGLDMRRRLDEAKAIVAERKADEAKPKHMTTVVLDEDSDNVLAVYDIVVATRAEAMKQGRARMVARLVKDGIEREQALAFAEDYAVIVTPSEKVDW